MSRLVIVCHRCGHEYRRPVVPAGALADSRAEVERLLEAMRAARDALGPGDDEVSDSPGNMAFAILSAALDRRPA